MQFRINLCFLFSLLLFISSCQENSPKGWSMSQLRPVVLEYIGMELMVPHGFYYDSDLSADPEKMKDFINSTFRVKDDENRLFNMMVNQIITERAGTIEIVADTSNKNAIIIIYERDYVPMHPAEARNITFELEKSIQKTKDKNPAINTVASPAQMFKAKHFLGYICYKINMSVPKAGNVYLYVYVISDEINTYSISVISKEDVMYDICIANAKMLTPAIKK
jgi:hypothetical protein